VKRYIKLFFIRLVLVAFGTIIQGIKIKNFVLFDHVSMQVNLKYPY